MRKNTTRKSWLVNSILLMAFSNLAFADIIYVDAGATGSNDGSTWADAYVDFQDALNDAHWDDIWVAAGTYKPVSTSFKMENNVAIYGGFDGTETTLSQRDVQNNVTILSGDLLGNDVPIGTPCDDCHFDNRSHVFYHPDGTDLDATAVLDGFTITGGRADGSGDHAKGGGMFNYNSSPTISNCIFISNFAFVQGGGMYNYNSSPTVTGCTFSSNYAGGGGGMNCDFNSNPTIVNCKFIANSAKYGGGMGISYNSRPTVTNSTFSSNSADELGGGIFSIGYNCNPKLSNCTITGNSAGDYGGGMYCDSSSSVVNRKLIVSNCIFWDNSASSGNEFAIISNSTIDVNYSDIQGGFVGIYDGGIDNIIIWGSGNIESDPIFTDADGPDDTYGTEDDNLRLSLGSPCIDAGDNDLVPAGITTDLDNRPRFIDDSDTLDTGNMVCQPKHR